MVENQHFSVSVQECHAYFKDTFNFKSAQSLVMFEKFSPKLWGYPTQTPLAPCENNVIYPSIRNWYPE